MTFKMSQEERNTIHALYSELIQQGKGKTEIYRELAETTGKTPSSISSLIWRMENPDKEKENQRKKNQQKKKVACTVSSTAFDPEQFIQHYRGLVEENRTLKDELATLQKEFEELRQNLVGVLNRAKIRYKINKDLDTNNFIVSVEEEKD